MSGITDFLVKNLTGVANKVSQVIENALTDEKGNKFSSLKAHLDDKGIKLSVLSDTVASKEINVKYPPGPLSGLTGSGDETEKLEAIMQFAKANKYNKVYIPSGTFSVRYLNYRDGVYIEGAGLSKTIIKALASSEQVFMKSIDSPTQQINVSNFTLDGAKLNDAQHGLGLIAYPLQTSPYHGGVWYSVFKNLKVKD